MAAQQYTPVSVSVSFIVWMTVGHILFMVLAGVVLECVCCWLGHEEQKWWIIVVSFWTMQIYAQLTHWAGHRSWSGMWYKAHMGHHLEDYPPSKFLSESYQACKKDNTFAYIPSFFLVPVTVNLLFVSNPTWVTALSSFACGVFVMWFADYIHVSMHQRDHSWERYGWFQMLRALHYYHHKGSMKHNYAMADFWFDVLVLGFQIQLPHAKS
eukprot:GILK01009865.1.p1 GENE.GILK01009865.1~~GILK01009865.1.p1  ORF type:complete len:218 (-),score=13.22 GILK01009865.1:85-717(-)